MFSSLFLKNENSTHSTGISCGGELVRAKGTWRSHENARFTACNKQQWQARQRAECGSEGVVTWAQQRFMPWRPPRVFGDCGERHASMRIAWMYIHACMPTKHAYNHTYTCMEDEMAILLSYFHRVDEFACMLLAIYFRGDIQAYLSAMKTSLDSPT